jgi:hypothetical protein
MLQLISTSDILRIVTSAAVSTHVQTSWIDKTGSSLGASGRQNTVITTASTTTIVPAPGSSVDRAIKSIFIRNTHATNAQTVTLQMFDGTTSVDIASVNLTAGESLQYTDELGFLVLDFQMRVKQNSLAGASGAAVNSLQLVVLSTDVTNNNGTANTMQDITGFSFPVSAGETYYFKFTIQYTSAATTTGARFSINGPASPTALRFHSRYSLTATTETLNHGLSAYDTPAGANATPAATGSNIAIIEGFITPSAAGTVIARFASEVASSAVIARAGSLLEWIRVL